MKPYFEKDGIEIYHGHVLDVLKQMPKKYVQMCVTSPPYYGLRNYGTDSVVWDDPGDCPTHEWGEPCQPTHKGQVKDSKAVTFENATGQNTPTGKFCIHCGAWFGSYGLEPTVELYVKHTVDIFREVRRVLRDDGVIWVNIGSSYTSGGRTHRKDFDSINTVAVQNLDRLKNPTGYKPKDLIPVPWLVGIALQSDGWYLRSDIIWEKPNCLPESVKDRPTGSHEYVLLLSKNERYFYDKYAVLEPHKYDGRKVTRFSGSPKYRENGGAKNDTMILKGSERWPGTGRNLRSVWTIPTQPFRGSHFAAFPEALVERCIKSSTSEKGCCAKCGAPFQRVVEKIKPASREVTQFTPGGQIPQSFLAGNRQDSPSIIKTKAWCPTCDCNAGIVPCTVLDIFGGTGRTGIVSKRFCRKAVLVDLSPEYIDDMIKNIFGNTNAPPRHEQITLFS